MAPRSLGGKELPHSLFINSDLLSGVVDPKMKIYGLTNVRVVDASVIPLTTGVAIQSTVYAIAEKVGPKLEWIAYTLTVSSRLRIFLERSGVLNRRECTTPRTEKLGSGVPSHQHNSSCRSKTSG
jgi:hypothetical protein